VCSSDLDFFNRRYNWDETTLKTAFEAEGFDTEVTVISQQEERLLVERDRELWFAPESSWGSFMNSALGEADFTAVKSALASRAKAGPLTWRWKSAQVNARL
jgi:hypothetical protein